MYGKSYWTEHLGEGWVEVLKPLLKDPYMEKLMNFLMVQYALEEVHPEDYKSLFRAFKLCPWEKLRVVVIGTEPSPLVGLGPLAFSDITTISPNPSAMQIRNCVEKLNQTLNLDFDFTFETWAQQGILMLNRSSSCPKGQQQGHKKQWKKFFGMVLMQIVLEKPGTIFLLWGKDAKQYAEVLSHNQHVFTWEHPLDAFLEYREWECPNFAQINLLIESLNGPDKLSW